MEITALKELFPDWAERGAPLHIQVKKEMFYFLPSASRSITIPGHFIPKIMHNQGNYIISLSALCLWLSQQAEQAGVTVLSGVTATELLYNNDGSIAGVLTGDSGIDKNGRKKSNYSPGIELRAKQTILAEGSRGNLSERVLNNFNLCRNIDKQHYSIGFKELWRIHPDKFIPGLVIHGFGWPLNNNASGGFFLYHGEKNHISFGITIDLNYKNYSLNPFEEFQKIKSHPLVKSFLTDAVCECYGARSITKGGYNSLPDTYFPGGVIVGCAAGTLNPAKLKGIHTAIKSGMLAAQYTFELLLNGKVTHSEFNFKNNNSSLHHELYKARNFSPAMHKLTFFGGCLFNFMDQAIFSGKIPITLHDTQADHCNFNQKKSIIYSNKKTQHNKNTALYLANIIHNDDQPCHLKFKNNASVNDPITYKQLQYLCPAGVYEITTSNEEDILIINSQNCLHCKSCDIKERNQNLLWSPPEAGSGPNYVNM